MAAVPEVPELPEQLTPAWLDSALGWRTRSAEREVLGQGQGFLGDIIRLTLDHDDLAVPRTVIVKLPKKANRAVGEMLGVYEREVLFFQTFGSGFPVRIPHVHFSHYDPDAGSARQREILGAPAHARFWGGEALTAQAPVTLVHNDLRLDNVCFDGSECAYLDWQLLRAGPAAYDVAYFLGGALDEPAGRDEELGILERYHRALGRADYAFDRFLRDYRRGLVLSLAAVVPQSDVAIDAGRGQAMMARWRRRLEARLAQAPLDTLMED